MQPGRCPEEEELMTTQQTQPQWTPASGPGALPGWMWSCPRPGCANHWGSTMQSDAQRQMSDHAQWHADRDRADDRSSWDDQSFRDARPDWQTPGFW